MNRAQQDAVMTWVTEQLVALDRDRWSAESVLKTGYNVPRCGDRPYVEVEFSSSGRRQVGPSENWLDSDSERIVMRKEETVTIKIFGRADHDVESVAEDLEDLLLRFSGARSLRQANITPVRTEVTQTVPTLPNHEMELAAVLPVVVHVERFRDVESGPGIDTVIPEGQVAP